MHNTQQLKDGHELKGLCAVCCVQGAKGVQGGVYRAVYTGCTRMVGCDYVFSSLSYLLIRGG